MSDSLAPLFRHINPDGSTSYSLAGAAEEARQSAGLALVGGAGFGLVTGCQIPVASNGLYLLIASVNLQAAGGTPGRWRFSALILRNLAATSQQEDWDTETVDTTGTVTIPWLIDAVAGDLFGLAASLVGAAGPCSGSAQFGVLTAIQLTS